MPTIHRLRLVQITRGLPGLTKAQRRTFAEAASCCLHANEHRPPVILRVQGLIEPKCSLVPLQVTQQMLWTYNEPGKAAEFGACGVAILLMMTFLDLRVEATALIGGGFDFWLVPQEAPVGDYRFRDRLEVSGIYRGRWRLTHRFNKRMGRQKDPAYVVVVEFSVPAALVGRT